MISTNQIRFKKITFITIIAVYLLILVGGIVRSMGAGMGCPDWPKCFGQVVPPLNVSELPENYQDTFLEMRINKNLRLASTLQSLGFSDLASNVTSDPLVFKEESFNVNKAWIEYLNRLVGVLIGLLIILTTVFSFSYVKLNLKITVLAIFSLILVIFQGWVGSLVVSTNLLPGFVSFHLFLALLLVAVLLYIYFLAVDEQNILLVNKKIYALLILVFVLLIPQFFLGTSIRGDVDALIQQQIERSEIIDTLPINFYIHRSFSLLFLACFIYLFKYFKTNQLLQTRSGKLIKLAAVCVLIEIVGGAIMAYFAIPSFVQPVHLLASVILFGSIFYLFLLSTKRTNAIT